MEILIAILARLPGFLDQPDLIPGLLLTGAGTSVFLIADNGAQGFRLMTALFVLTGYAAGAVLTALGLFMIYGVLAPTVAL
jgi:hypothetical protein